MTDAACTLADRTSPGDSRRGGDEGRFEKRTGQPIGARAWDARPLRLLGAWERTGRNDLATHLGTFGAMPGWAQADADGLVDAVSRAGLLGRGGAGFPTAVKLRARHAGANRGSWIGGLGSPARVDRVRSGRNVLIVNAMEGEPASLKDTVLLACAPHLVLDGAQFGAIAVGARRVIVCIPAGRDDTAAAVLRALAERRRTHLLPVPTEVARPPGRYVAGEESALVGWLAGGAGVPAFRMDKSAPLLLAGAPVLVHNAETLAQLALIARDADGAGSAGEPATTLVTVSGAVARPGVYEVELGRRTLGEVIGLAVPSAPSAAALVGGYGGTWVSASAFAAPYCREGLAPLGAAPGAGVVVALAEGACGLAESARIASAMAAESAGQCGPCVFGLPALAEDLGALAVGRAEPEVVARIARRAGAITGRGACRHPDGVARMVQSALAVFDADVRRHAARRPCRGARRPSLLPPWGPGR